MLHREECVRKTEKARDSRALWFTLWPNACYDCDTRGIRTWHESVPMPFGPGSCSMPMAEACDECVGSGRCPRCGHEQGDPGLFGDAEHPCEICNWNWGKTPGDTPPDYWECDCLELEAEAVAARLKEDYGGQG